jgi:hypothetical protein
LRHSRDSDLQTVRPNQAESPEITHGETHGATAEIRASVKLLGSYIGGNTAPAW